MPERDVLEPDERIRAHDPREAADALGDDRVALVRHRRGALLALAERLGDLGHLGARQVADLERELLERGGDERERGEQLGMPVALDDLRRDRLGLEPEPLAREALELRVGRRVGADRAGELADAHRLERVPRSRSRRALELERPAGELEAEGRRLGVNAVRPADADVVAVVLRPLEHRVQRAVERPRAGARPPSRTCSARAGVDDVRRGQAVVDPAPGRAELGGDGVDEGGQVVLGLALELGDALGRRRLSRAPGSRPRRPRERRRARPSASSAASSTSSQRASLLSSDQTPAISGRE